MEEDYNIQFENSDFITLEPIENFETDLFLSKADVLLDDVSSIEMALVSLVHTQRDFVLNGQNDIDSLFLCCREIEEKITYCYRQCSALFGYELLEIDAIFKVFYCFDQLSYFSMSLFLLKDELIHVGVLENGRIGILHILRQPFPDVIIKGKQLGEDILIVKLMLYSSINVESYSKVVCSYNSFPDSKNKIKLLSMEEMPLDPSTLCASFELKFLKGTRLETANLKFTIEVRVKLKNGNVVLRKFESLPSESFIVITNENQWERAENIIFKRRLFLQSTDIPWNQFCNCLQYHFFKAIRQNPDIRYRTLQLRDFYYIRNRFFNNSNYANDLSFETFWNWFGKSLSIIRFQTYVNILWQQGLVYGILTKEEVNYALNGQPPGTFIVRFSETKGGRWAIGYVSLKGEGIKHYLIKPQDISRTNTLADFLFNCGLFISMLKLIYYDEDNFPIFQLVPKGECLRPYLNLESLEQERDDGYDPLENPYSNISFRPPPVQTIYNFS